MKKPLVLPSYTFSAKLCAGYKVAYVRRSITLCYSTLLVPSRSPAIYASGIPFFPDTKACNTSLHTLWKYRKQSNNFTTTAIINLQNMMYNNFKTDNITLFSRKNTINFKYFQKKIQFYLKVRAYAIQFDGKLPSIFKRRDNVPHGKNTRVSYMHL